MKILKQMSALLVILCFTFGTLHLNAQGNSNKDKKEKVAKMKDKTESNKDLNEKSGLDKEQKALALEQKETMKAMQERIKKASPEEKKVLQAQMKQMKEEYKEEQSDFNDKGQKKIRDEIEVLERKREKLKTNNGKGNAYGKNKNGLSGREFGQQRAYEARNRIEVEREIVEKRRSLVVLAEERIEKAERRLETERVEQKLEEVEVVRRRSAIQRAMVKLGVLKSSLAEEERILNEQERKIKIIVEND